MEDTRKTWSIESTKPGSYWLTEIEGFHRFCLGPECICTRSSKYKLWILAWCFCGTPNCGNRCNSDSFAWSWDFLLSGCCYAHSSEACLAGGEAWKHSRGKEFHRNSTSWNPGILITHILIPPLVWCMDPRAFFYYYFIVSAFKDWILA